MELVSSYLNRSSFVCGRINIVAMSNLPRVSGEMSTCQSNAQRCSLLELKQTRVFGLSEDNTDSVAGTLPGTSFVVEQSELFQVFGFPTALLLKDTGRGNHTIDVPTR
jgi:hypothetical protein